jgi:hypothetical protein
MGEAACARLFGKTLATQAREPTNQQQVADHVRGAEFFIGLLLFRGGLMCQDSGAIEMPT